MVSRAIGVTKVVTTVPGAEQEPKGRPTYCCIVVRQESRGQRPSSPAVCSHHLLLPAGFCLFVLLCHFLFFNVHRCSACMCIWVTSDPLQVQLQAVVSCHVVPGSEAGSSGRADSVLKGRAISPAPLSPFYDGLSTAFPSFHLFPHHLAWVSSLR